MGFQALTLDPESDDDYSLPSVLNGNYGWSSQTFTQDNLWSDGPTQYAVWVDEAKKARLARRAHTRAWESSIDLSAVPGTALSAAFTDDSHNVLCIGVDERGYIHAAGDMHAVALKYMRTRQPGSLNDWVSGSMVGTEESQATYPVFVRTTAGPLLFFYRDGVPGGGDLILNRFNSATRTWSRVAKLIDGKADAVNAYPMRIPVDQVTGRIHLLWTWRDDVIEVSNVDYCYAYSDDHGTTWRKMNGDVYTLPITVATGEVVFDIDSGFILNNGGMDVDTAGRPHAVGLVRNAAGIHQINHLYYDGVTWHRDQVSSFVTDSLRRPTLACFPDGRVWILYNFGGTLGGFLRVYDVTNPASVTQRVLYSVDRLQFEPVFDFRALHQRNRLYVMAPMTRSAGAQVGDPVDLGAQANVPVLVVR